MKDVRDPDPDLLRRIPGLGGIAPNLGTLSPLLVRLLPFARKVGRLAIAAGFLAFFYLLISGQLA